MQIIHKTFLWHNGQWQSLAYFFLRGFIGFIVQTSTSYSWIKYIKKKIYPKTNDDLTNCCSKTRGLSSRPPCSTLNMKWLDYLTYFHVCALTITMQKRSEGKTWYTCVCVFLCASKFPWGVPCCIQHTNLSLPIHILCTEKCYSRHNLNNAFIFKFSCHCSVGLISNSWLSISIFSFS